MTSSYERDAALDRAANETGFYRDGARILQICIWQKVPRIWRPRAADFGTTIFYAGKHASMCHQRRNPVARLGGGCRGGNQALRRRTEGESAAKVRTAMESLERGIKEHGDRLERMSIEDSEILRNRIIE
jgi:hypothetical protein